MNGPFTLLQEDITTTETDKFSAAATTAHNNGSQNQNTVELVLVIPAKLTRSAYATLVAHNCVARKWHNEGRHGSRTHSIEDGMDDKYGRRTGLPLLKTPETIDYITSVLARRDDINDTTADGNKPNADDGKACLWELLCTPGVELIYESPTISNKIPKDEIIDATVHRNRMPQDFTSKIREFLEERKQKHMQHSHSIPPSSSTRSSSFTFCELFSGIGGFGVALEALGGRCVFASEIFEPSRRLYCNNLDTSHLPDGVISGDIWDVDSRDIPRHDLLVAGFPCQPFSTLGNQPGLTDKKVTTGRKQSNGESNENCGRGQLFTQIVRVLKDRQPVAFLLENVPGLINTDNGNALCTIISALEAVGYDVTKEVCSSRGLTAQSRKRLYIVGIKQRIHNNKSSASNQTLTPTEFKFPFIPDLKLRAADVLHTDEELYQPSFSGTGVPTELARCNRQEFATSAAWFQLSNSQMTQLLNRSKSWKPAKLSWGNKTIDTIDSHYGISIGKGNSQLVPCPAPHHPRRFTPRECARIMGFNDLYCLGEFDNTKKLKPDNSQVLFNSFIKEQYFMLGNAVCPPVIAAIAGAILDHCSICIVPYESCTDNGNGGIWIAVQMALDVIPPCRRAQTYERLIREYTT